MIDVAASVVGFASANYYHFVMEVPSPLESPCPYMVILSIYEINNTDLKEGMEVPSTPAWPVPCYMQCTLPAFLPAHTGRSLSVLV